MDLVSGCATVDIDFILTISLFIYNRFPCQIIKTLILICAIGLSAAQKSCPNDASGIYPLCTCENFEFIYNVTTDACVKVNRDVCPEPAYQTRFGCRCPNEKDFFDDYYWLCRTKLYLPNHNETNIIIREVCPVYETGVYPHCEKIPCRSNQSGSYEPYCRDTNVYIPRNGTVCPLGEVGTPPFCWTPCPRYRARKLRIFRNA